jgi:hypothetical protein
MAPEQFDDVKRVDVRADIYSFGVMLFQMITGRLPFSGCSLSEYRHLHQRVPPPTVSMEELEYRQQAGLNRVPKGQWQSWLASQHWLAGMISSICNRCLAKDPTNRFQNFQEVRRELFRVGHYPPQPPPLRIARRLTEDELLSLGLSCLELGQENLALEAFDQLIERYPRNRQGYLQKAKLLMTKPHRYDEGCAILDQAESTGGRRYTQLDADLVLVKILDQLFKVFEQANRALVIFRDGRSRRLVVKASRTRWPQDEDFIQVFLSDKRRISIIWDCLDHAPFVCCNHHIGFPVGSHSDEFRVMCAPLCDDVRHPDQRRSPSRTAFGVIWLETNNERAGFTSEDDDLLRGMVEGVIPPWIFQTSMKNRTMGNYLEILCEDGTTTEIPLRHFENDDPDARSRFDDEFTPPIVSVDTYVTDHPSHSKALYVTKVRFYGDKLEKPISFIAPQEECCLDAFTLLAGQEGKWTLRIEHRDYGPAEYHLEYSGERAHEPVVCEWHHDKDEIGGN